MSGIEDAAVREWSEGLADINGEQIKTGLNAWAEEWPPSLPEFRNACLGRTSGKNEFGLDYVPEYYREQPKADRSRMLSSDQREAKRAANIEFLKTLKSAIRKEP